MKYRSSSTGSGFGFLANFNPVESHVAAWGKKKHATAEPVQEKGSKVENNSARMAAVTAVKQPSQKPKQSEKVVFTIGSPIRGENSLEPELNSNSGKHFTDVCAWPECKKDIVAGTHDAYMYGYLQAFCSHECRDKQVALDEKSRPPPPPKAVKALEQMISQWYDQNRMDLGKK